MAARALLRWWLLCALLCRVAGAGAALCGEQYCQCEDTEVICHGEAATEVSLDQESLPPGLTTLTFTNFSRIQINTNTFSGQSDLKELSLENVKDVELNKYFFSSVPTTGYLTYFKIENVQTLTLASENCFENFPHAKKINFKNVNLKVLPSRGLKLKSDILTLESCIIGEVARAGVFSDSANLQVVNNEFDAVRTHAFSGNNLVFNFSGNAVRLLETEAFQITALETDFSNNQLETVEGSPFQSLSPTPECVPDPDSAEYEYEDSVPQYRIVAPTSFKLEYNTFAQFNLSMLNFPGCQKVLLGSLSVNKNKVKCECSQLKELVEVVDYDYQAASHHPLGEFVLFKEFYSTGVCSSDADSALSVTHFSRDNFHYTDKGVVCQKRPRSRQQQARGALVPAVGEEPGVAGSRVQPSAGPATTAPATLGLLLLVSVLSLM